MITDTGMVIAAPNPSLPVSLPLLHNYVTVILLEYMDTIIHMDMHMVINMVTVINTVKLHTKKRIVFIQRMTLTSLMRH